MTSTPKVFNWIGNQSPVAYWDDASNWAEGEYPNQKEAIAVFSKTANQATKSSDERIYILLKCGSTKSIL